MKQKQEIAVAFGRGSMAAKFVVTSETDSCFISPSRIAMNLETVKEMLKSAIREAEADIFSESGPCEVNGFQTCDREPYHLGKNGRKQ